MLFKMGIIVNICSLKVRENELFVLIFFFSVNDIFLMLKIWVINKKI